jgi:hypothetical protein
MRGLLLDNLRSIQGFPQPPGTITAAFTDCLPNLFVCKVDCC